MWKVEFVNQKASDEFESLPKDIRARMLHLIKKLEVKGNTLGEPHTKSLGNGMFEIRAKSSEGVARSMYCYRIGKVILILVIAVKKQDKLPKSVMEIAKKRLEEFINGNN